MVNTRTHIRKSSVSHQVQLRGRHYPSTDFRPSLLQVETRCSTVDRNVPRFPLAESHFADARVQPYIHNCSVIVVENSHIHHLIVFFKNHCRLPVNRSLAALDFRGVFRGDLLVMRAAARNGSSFVNMRGRDSAIADFAVKRLVTVLAQHPKRGIPSALLFHKRPKVLCKLRRRD